MEEKMEIKQGVERISSIDRLRGLAVFCMIFFQFASNFTAMGIVAQFSKHFSADPSSTDPAGILIFKNTNLADLVAPLFMFAIAMTFILSYRRRTELYGKTKTNIHFILRNLTLIGIGFFLNGVNRYILDFSGGYIFIDYIFMALMAVCLVFLLLAIIFSIKPLQKRRKTFAKGTLFSFSALGLVNAIVALISYIEKTAGIAGSLANTNYWMVLQSLGMAGLISLPFMSLNFTKRTISCAALLGAYLVFYHFLGGHAAVEFYTQGGFMGSFGWALIVLGGSLFSEMFFKDRKKGYIVAAVFAAVALILYFLIPINKQGGVKPDPTFLVVTTALSMLFFIVIDLFNFYKCSFDPLAWWGKYPLLLYLMEFSVIGLYTVLAPESILQNAPLYLAIITLAFFMALFTAVVYFLNKKKIKINL